MINEMQDKNLTQIYVAIDLNKSATELFAFSILCNTV
jgi:hypothetical protein